MSGKQWKTKATESGARDWKEGEQTSKNKEARKQRRRYILLKISNIYIYIYKYTGYK